MSECLGFWTPYHVRSDSSDSIDENRLPRHSPGQICVNVIEILGPQLSSERCIKRNGSLNCEILRMIA